MAITPNGYEAMRRRIQSQTKAQQDQADEAVRRRFAAMGALNSGEAVKQSELAKQGVQAQGNDAMAQVDMAEQQEKSQRDFAREERVASQKFQTAEREATQIYNKQLFDEDMKFKQLVQSQNYDVALKQYDLALQDLLESKQANRMNAYTAMANAFGIDDWEDSEKMGWLQGQLKQFGYDMSKPASVMTKRSSGQPGAVDTVAGTLRR